MIFQDNVIKEYLKNVYFITGTPCGGKTTISRELAKRHNLLVYDIDEQFTSHQSISNAMFQPSMNKEFKGADDFFGRTIEEYKKWLIDNTREQLDFVILDLIRLSQNQTVLCDCHLTVEEADQLTESSRIVFLIKDPSNLVDDYCNRPDHQGFSNYINSASDIEKAKAVCNATLQSLNEKRCNDIRNSNYFWVERTKHSTVSETVRQVEQHFNLIKNDFHIDTLEIRRVEKNTDLADQLIHFVENFSWEDTKEHILWMLRNWVFRDWETEFVALVNGQIVGMTSIMKTDYYPLPEIYPWISSVFVMEDYRGHRISEKLIHFANEYAKVIGFDKTYIPSEHTGLYERYGYRYLKDIVNYGNGIDRLYVKELK
ncbi:GnaT-family acetyltransferase [Lachnospiraceae bacterium KM106-2]|nr:GnaT-family acetyltransferase [Lachnospiraceae bacterium KM106-2]